VYHRRMRTAGVVVLLACAPGCGAQFGGTVATVDGAVGLDATDAPTPVDAFPTGRFGPPSKVVPASTGGSEDDSTLSSDGLELIVALAEAAVGGRKHLYYAQRASVADPFVSAARLPFDLTGNTEQTPRFTADNRLLYFASDRTGTLGGLDIFEVTHPAPGDNWGMPVHVEGVSDLGTDKWFAPCSDGTYLVIRGSDIFEGTLGGAAPVRNDELSSTSGETGPFLTADCKTVFFASTRPDGTRNQLYTATRPDTTAAWGIPTVFDDFAELGGNQQDPWMSADGHTFVFVSDVNGDDVYIATR
jgi:hypothetical protein